MHDQWRAWHAISDVAGYLIELRPTDRARAEDTTVNTPARGTAGYAPILVSSCRRDVRPAGRVVVHATFQVDCDEFASQVDRDTTAGRVAMADAIRALLQKSGASSPEAIAAIVEAWCASPPTFALEITQTFTTQNDLPRPIQLDPAHVSDTDRLIAEAIREAGVAPGDYVGAAAKALDRDTLAPAALRVLTQRLAQHSLHDLLLYAMHQLQCVVLHIERTLRDIQRAATHMSVTWDPEQRYEHLEQEQLTLRRCVEAAVEAALRTAPAADLPVDVVTWSEILAAAHAYLAAASRSEAIHHQVTPRALRISQAYEIELISAAAAHPDAVRTPNANTTDRHTYDLDIEAFRHARAAYNMAERARDNDDQAVDAGDGQLAPADVDAAMSHGYGVTATDLFSVLLGLITWRFGPHEGSVAVATPQDVVDHVLAATVMGEEPEGPARVEAALRMLTSTSHDMRTADWKPWHARTRRRRLLVQPVPVLEDGSMIIAPHFCKTSLMVYQNHLQQGQLPWSQPPAPPAVETALSKVRDRRNKALERDVARLLREHGWHVVEVVKETKPQRLGVPVLNTEIDAVAGHPDRATIWLLEVKDPVDVYAIPEIRRHLDRFFDSSSKTPSYIEQFQRKIADLAPHAAAVAHALGLPARDTSHPYTVKALFVTRRPVPAAYVSSDAEFVALPDLVSRICS